MADETGQVGCAAPRLLRLLALTTNCHLAQDILSYFTGIAPALRTVILVAVSSPFVQGFSSRRSLSCGSLVAVAFVALR